MVPKHMSFHHSPVSWCPVFFVFFLSRSVLICTECVFIHFRELACEYLYIHGVSYGHASTVTLQIDKVFNSLRSLYFSTDIAKWVTHLTTKRFIVLVFLGCWVLVSQSVLYLFQCWWGWQYVEASLFLFGSHKCWAWLRLATSCCCSIN